FFFFFSFVFFFFFFQAEDGIRDLTVTGVQTCALPISCPALHPWLESGQAWRIPLLRGGIHDSAGSRKRNYRAAEGKCQAGGEGQIGRASCRERGERSEGAGGVKKKKKEEEWRVVQREQ